MAHAATSATATDTRRPTARHAVALDRVPELPAQGADSASSLDHPMGSEGLERHTAPLGALQRLRHEERLAPASELGRERHRVGAVPGLSNAQARELLPGSILETREWQYDEGLRGRAE
jgi:hypothetical protein